MTLPETFSQPSAEELADGSSYSTAFEKMTRNDADDIIGLVAYALYKRMIQEEVLEGVRKPGLPKNPSPKTVEFYRSAAEQMLSKFAAGAIDEATPEVQQSAMLERLNAVNEELKGAVRRASSIWQAIGTNLVAWIISIFLTAVIIYSLRLANPAEVILDTIDPHVPPAQSGSPNP